MPHVVWRTRTRITYTVYTYVMTHVQYTCTPYHDSACGVTYTVRHRCGDRGYRGGGAALGFTTRVHALRPIRLVVLAKALIE